MKGLATHHLEPVASVGHAYFSTTKKPMLGRSQGRNASRPSSGVIDYNVARHAPRECQHKRLPIVINGAAPAGLILAIGLKNARIPFEICERERHDLPSKPRRNHVSILERKTLLPLKKFLSAPTYHSFLRHMTLDPVDDNSDPWGILIHTERLLDVLRRQVPIHYGHTLHREGISCRENVITSQYVAGSAVRTFRGSLLFGADGKFSAGKRNCRTSHIGLNSLNSQTNGQCVGMARHYVPLENGDLHRAV